MTTRRQAKTYITHALEFAEPHVRHSHILHDGELYYCMECGCRSIDLSGIEHDMTCQTGTFYEALRMVKDGR
jgi:hypothetical protein